MCSKRDWFEEVERWWMAVNSSQNPTRQLPKVKFRSQVPITPEWHSSKRGPGESIEELQAQRSWRKPSGNRSKGCQQTVAMMLSKSV